MLEPCIVQGGIRHSSYPLTSLLPAVLMNQEGQGSNKHTVYDLHLSGNPLYNLELVYLGIIEGELQFKKGWEPLLWTMFS